MLFLGVFYGVFVTSVYKQISGLDDKILTMAGALGSVANGLSRIGWGTLSDKIGFKNTYKMLLTIQFFCSITLIYFKNTQMIYVLLVFLSFSCEGGHMALFPGVCGKIFGIKSGPTLATILNTSISSSAFTSMLIT